MTILRILGVILTLVLVICYSSFFVVDERQKALVLQFGQIKAVKENPGLAFKIPLIQEVVRYDDRILSLDTQPLEVTPLDDRRLVVDAFMRYRITDVVRFRQAVGTGGTASAEKRLERILNAAMGKSTRGGRRPQSPPQRRDLQGLRGAPAGRGKGKRLDVP